MTDAEHPSLDEEASPVPAAEPAPVPPAEPSPQRHSRHARRVRALLATAAAVLIVSGLAAVWVVRQIDPPGAPGDPVAVEIPSGSSVARIAAILDDKGVIGSARIFRFYARLTGAGEFQAGIYGKGEFRRHMAMGDALSALESGPRIAYSRLTVPEGFTLARIAERVGRLPGHDADAFLALARGGTLRSPFQPPAVKTLEGLVFPDTYLVAEDESDAKILQRMTALFGQVADSLRLREGAAKVGMTPYQVATVASLVEAETKVASERPLVAAVVYNRLRRGMALQIDATVLYALGVHKTRVLFRDLEVDSPYNTYRHAGLPPTPIAAPGEESLRAALHPADVPYLYYVKIDAAGHHAFATTPEQHQANVARARRAGVR